MYVRVRESRCAYVCLSMHVVAVEVKLGPKVVMLNLLACTVVWFLQAPQHRFFLPLIIGSDSAPLRVLLG